MACSWFATSTKKKPFMAMLISPSRGTCLISHHAHLQVLCAFVAYQFAKFACKVKIQNSSFSIPLTLVMPALLAVVTLMCHKRTNPDKECTYNSLGLEYAFFRFVQTNITTCEGRYFVGNLVRVLPTCCGSCIANE